MKRKAIAKVFQIGNMKYVVYYRNKLVMQTSYKTLAIKTAKSINNGEETPYVYAQPPKSL